MAKTPVTLYRLGKASSPRMDHVRSKDVGMRDIEGVAWVRAGTGGVSTSAFPGPLQGIWWRLEAGYDHGDLLLVWNDHHMHWLWEPTRDMRLAEFQAELRAAYPFFVRVD